MSLCRYHAIHYRFLDCAPLVEFHLWQDQLPVKSFVQLNKRLLSSDSIKDKITLIKAQKEFLSRVKTKVIDLTNNYTNFCQSYGWIRERVERTERDLSLSVVDCKKIFDEILYFLSQIESFCLKDTAPQSRHIFGDSLVFSIWYALVYPNNPVLFPFHFDHHPQLHVKLSNAQSDKYLHDYFSYTYRASHEVIDLLSIPKRNADFDSAALIYSSTLSKDPHLQFAPLNKNDFLIATPRYEEVVDAIVADCRDNIDKFWVSEFANHAPTE